MSETDSRSPLERWPRLPQTEVCTSIRQLIGSSGENITQFVAAGFLSSATVSIRDDGGQWWKSQLAQKGQRVQRPRWNVEETLPEDLDCDWQMICEFQAPIPVEVLDEMIENFPEAECHLPGMILRKDSAYDYRAGEPLTVTLVASSRGNITP